MEEKRAIAYIRVSTESQAKYGTSPQTQKKEIKEYAIKNSIRIVKWFEDHISGKEAYNRTEFLSSLEYINEKKNNVELYLVHKIDRSGRNFVEWAMMQRELRKLGLVFTATSQNVNTNDKIGRLLANILASVAEYDREDIVEKTTKGVKELMLQGYWPRQSPTGYKKDKDSTIKKCRPDIPDPKKYRFIQEVFSLALTGEYSQAQIMTILKAKGCIIPKQTLSAILRNKFYCGYVCWPKWGIEVKGIHYKHRVLDLEDWETLQIMLDNQNKNKKKKKPGKPEFFLAGSLLCLNCKGKMAYGYAKSMYPRYWCRSKLCKKKDYFSMELAHMIFMNYVDEITIDPDYLSHIIGKVASTLDVEKGKRKVSLEALQETVATLELKLLRLEEKNLNDDIDGVTYKSLKDKYTDQLQYTKLRLQKQSKRVVEKSRLENQARTAVEQIPLIYKDASDEFKRRFNTLVFPGGFSIENNKLLNHELNPLLKHYPINCNCKASDGADSRTHFEPDIHIWLDSFVSTLGSVKRVQPTF